MRISESSGSTLRLEATLPQAPDSDGTLREYWESVWRGRLKDVQGGRIGPENGFTKWYAAVAKPKGWVAGPLNRVIPRPKKSYRRAGVLIVIWKGDENRGIKPPSGIQALLAV